MLRVAEIITYNDLDEKSKVTCLFLVRSWNKNQSDGIKYSETRVNQSVILLQVFKTTFVFFGCVLKIIEFDLKPIKGFF